jgi:hypothetical protein
MSNVVDVFYTNYEELSALIEKTQQVSLRVWVSESFRRVLVLTMANYLESRVKTLIQELVKKKSASELVFSFLSNSMERQYHTYFNWETRNANKFFSLFGERFKNEMVKDVDSIDKLDEGIVAFLEIGNTRNILMHEELFNVDIGNKTPKEFYESFKSAIFFVDYLGKKFESVDF